MAVSENLIRVRKNIQNAMALRHRLGKSPANVKLIAVTKNQDVSTICAAIDAGVTIIGENRVQEALDKHDKLGTRVEWHLIGHLQTNKVRQAVPMFDLVHSVDSEKLAVEIDRVADKLNKIQDILIQVNVAAEDTKFGITPEQVLPLARTISDLEHVRLCGLMTIAPHYSDAKMTRPLFQEMFTLFMNLQAVNLYHTNIEWLSMGMTNDYEIAIEEGANLVRIGTGIFGVRQY